MTKYTYRDFESGRLRWTRGRFQNWQRGGLLNAWHAVFVRKGDALLVPEYCLTAETKAALPPKVAGL